MLEVGDRVMVRNCTLNNVVFDEGMATIKVVHEHTTSLYDVEFDEEPGEVYPRLVDLKQKRE